MLITIHVHVHVCHQLYMYVHCKGQHKPAILASLRVQWLDTCSNNAKIVVPNPTQVILHLDFFCTERRIKQLLWLLLVTWT